MPGPTGRSPDTRTLWELIDERVAATPDAPMAIDERGQSMTFAQYSARSEACAAGLVAMGVGEGTVVSWQLPTWLEAMVLCGGLARVGAVQVPLIPSYRGREVGFILRQSAAELFIVPDAWGKFDYRAMAAEVAPDSTRVHVIDPVARVLPEGDPSVLVPWRGVAGPGTLDEVRFLYYTSGTTGEPKGARHSGATLYGGVGGMLAMLQPGPDDRDSLVFPFAHIGGYVWLLTGLIAGSCHLLAERFDPETTIPMLAANGVTLAGTGTPFNLAYLAAQRELAATSPGKRLFPTVRFFMSGASPKPPHLHATMREELGGSGITSSYGMTEAPILTACGPDDPDDQRATTEGRAAPGVILAVVDQAGTALPAGSEGEVVVRGPQVCYGYVDPSLNGAWDEAGWLHTGDLAVLDEGGYVRITGRLKDVIIRKGENISAKEIEDLLYQHPAIGDVAVVGLPDPRVGEMACAVVAPAAGHRPPTFEEMVQFLRDRQVMVQKIPERLEIVDELPRNASGKVMKQDLRARYGPPPA